MDFEEINDTSLVFTYTVVAQDRASDSAFIEANALKLNGATIKDANNNDADVSSSRYFPVSAEHNWDYHQVDGSRSGGDTQQGGV